LNISIKFYILYEKKFYENFILYFSSNLKRRIDSILIVKNITENLVSLCPNSLNKNFNIDELLNIFANFCPKSFTTKISEIKSIQLMKLQGMKLNCFEII
jgi:hypothetical protein